MKIQHQQLLIKSLLIFIAFLFAIIMYYYFTNKWKAEKEIEERRAKIEKLKKEYQDTIDQTSRDFQTHLDSVQKDNGKLKEQSQKLIDKIHYYETRPDVDIDFLTAYRIISESNYEPRQSNGDVGQGQNN